LRIESRPDITLRLRNVITDLVRDYLEEFGHSISEEVYIDNQKFEIGSFYSDKSYESAAEFALEELQDNFHKFDNDYQISDSEDEEAEIFRYVKSLTTQNPLFRNISIF
jgi:hypothetical protein